LRVWSRHFNFAQSINTTRPRECDRKQFPGRSRFTD